MPYDPDWDDMSEHVTHITKDYNNRTAYDNMLSILQNQSLIRGNPFGIAKSRAPRDQRAVCFSEVPLHKLGRLAAKRSGYGIGFRKTAVLSAGGGPIWYVEKDTPQHKELEKLMTEGDSTGASHPIWKLTPMIDLMGEFRKSTGISKYRFEWEREWRFIGDFNFSLEDVSFLIIPEHLHTAAKGFFYNAAQENTGPNYTCPFIDAQWDIAR